MEPTAAVDDGLSHEHWISPGRSLVLVVGLHLYAAKPRLCASKVSARTELTGSTSDWFGRRRNLTFFVGLFIIGNIIQITAMSGDAAWIHHMMGRFVAGWGVGEWSSI